jgi:hypothetical protein
MPRLRVVHAVVVEMRIQRRRRRREADAQFLRIDGAARCQRAEQQHQAAGGNAVDGGHRALLSPAMRVAFRRRLDAAMSGG